MDVLLPLRCAGPYPGPCREATVPRDPPGHRWRRRRPVDSAAQRGHPLGEPRGSASLAQTGVDRAARAEHRRLSLAGDLIAEGERHPGDRRHLDAHEEHVLVARRRHVPASGLHHGKAEPLGLHLAVAAPVGAEQLAAGELEVAEVVRVVHDPHLVGVAVDDPHPRLEHPCPPVGDGRRRAGSRTRERKIAPRSGVHSAATMTRALLLALALLCTPALAKPPRLTLFIAVDALGTDLLLRSRPRLRAGLAQLIDRGAFYPDVRYQQAQTTTAPGHSVLSTGAYPWRTGVVGNRVLNRTSGKD